MNAIFALLPKILELMNGPAGQALMPIISQLLADLGNAHFPGVNANKAGEAGATLFDTNSVKWVQAALHLPVDGNYGDTTKAAVKAFQQAHPPLVVDGWAGSATQDALRATVKP